MSTNLNGLPIPRRPGRTLAELADELEAALDDEAVAGRIAAAARLRRDRLERELAGRLSGFTNHVVVTETHSYRTGDGVHIQRSAVIRAADILLDPREPEPAQCIVTPFLEANP